MKRVLLLTFYFIYSVSLRSQTLIGTTFNGGSDGGGTINVFTPGNLTAPKSFESVATDPFFADVIQARNGNLYGMTSYGGSHGYGIIFSFDPVNSVYKKIFDFDLINGGVSNGSLLQGADGNLYGMTTFGGSNGFGTIFSFDPTSLSYKKLYDFDGTTGAFPYGHLIQANDGKLYGMTNGGGDNSTGVIFSLDPVSSAYLKLKDFDNSNGSSPLGSLFQANDGKLYGMTTGGGIDNAGVIFSFDPASESYSLVKEFENVNGDNPSGASPIGSLVQASDGKLYGVTQGGGINYSGVIFSLDIYSDSFTNVKDFDFVGGFGAGGLVAASDGKLYGTTSFGGANGSGIIFSFDPGSSTYTTLRDLDIYDGTNPFGSLLQANDGKLYGLTSRGGLSGPDGNGVIFSFDLSSSTYTMLKDLGTNKNGSNISARPIRSKNGKFYGMTTNGGSGGAGVIFSFDPNTSNYTTLKDLDFLNGSHPYGSLLQANDGKFYGMTTFGGESPAFFANWSELGVIFSFDPGSSKYTKLMDLSDYDGYAGGRPYGSLIQANDGKLYGMTSGNGSGYRGQGLGVIFSFDNTSSTYTVLKDFADFDPGGVTIDAPNGGSPYGSLLQANDGKLYGITSLGGSNDLGVVFSYDLKSSVYTNLKDFDNTNGSHPYGSLIQARDGILYGMTYDGGTNDAGVIFSYDLPSSTFTKLYDFDYTNGSHPYGNLMQASDGKLYGMTSSGGSDDYGVVFSFDPASFTYTKLFDYDGSNGAMPYFGSGFTELADLVPPPLTLIGFGGQNKETVNSLFWTIADHQNFSYFDLQRSTNGQDFRDISQIQVDGNSDYSYDDNITADTATVYYYRLKLVDMDGNFKYSDVIKITVQLKEDFIFANPNPFKDQLVINIHSQIQDNAVFVLTDLNGRQLLRKNESLTRGPNVVQINETGRLPDGTYILTIITSNKPKSLKLVKSNY